MNPTTAQILDMAELKEQSNLLWQSFVSGNESAFRTLYDHTYSSLFRYGFHLFPDANGVRDLMQETYLALWRQRERGTEVRDVWVYLLVSFRNRLIDLKRKEKSREIPAIDPVISPESEWIAQENEAYRNRWLQCQLAELPERQREAIRLRYRLDMDYPEIAKRLGVSIQVVYNYVNRGIKALRSKTDDFEV
jgi:RNA polymerase sigma-70 factor (ECF subfamily)